MNAAITGFILGSLIGFFGGVIWCYSCAHSSAEELKIDMKRICREQANISTEPDRTS